MQKTAYEMRISDWSSDVCSSDLVAVGAVADAPTLATGDASGEEGATVPLDIQATLTDIDGTEALSITVSGVPEGAMLSAGTDLGGGVWSVEPTDISGLTVTLPERSVEIGRAHV